MGTYRSKSFDSPGKSSRRTPPRDKKDLGYRRDRDDKKEGMDRRDKDIRRKTYELEQKLDIDKKAKELSEKIDIDIKAKELEIDIKAKEIEDRIRDKSNKVLERRDKRDPGYRSRWERDEP